MAGPHWLDRLEAELRKHNLPAGYRARTARRTGGSLVRTRTGDHEHGCSSAAGGTDWTSRGGRRRRRGRNTTRRTFAGRHPVLAFGVAPMFRVVGTLMATLLLAWWSSGWPRMTTPQLREQTTPPTTLQLAVIEAVVWFVRLTPFILMAWGFAREAAGFSGREWGLLASVIVAAVALAFSMTAQPPRRSPGAGRLRRGDLAGPAFEQWLQAALPLAIGCVDVVVDAPRESDRLARHKPDVGERRSEA